MNCKLSDLRWMEDVRELWLVDSEGEPESCQETIRYGEYRHICNRCLLEFGDWDDATEHVA